MEKGGGHDVLVLIIRARGMRITCLPFIGFHGRRR